MADLSDLNVAQAVKIVGTDSTGSESGHVTADNGRLNINVGVNPNSPLSDSAGRFRTVLPVELMSYYFVNTDHFLKMNAHATTGTGTVALTLNKGSVTITNTTGTSDKVNFATKKFVRYSPGQTHKMTIAGRIGTTKTNVEKRWGMFTEFNGFYFKQTSSGLYVVVRDGGAGDAVTENVASQSSWNMDKLDGTGDSGFNLNTDNQGIYIIEWDWHGSGTVRFGVKFEHVVVYCHEFHYDFSQTDTVTRSPVLPINIEIKNVGAVTGNTTVLISAISCYKDGAYDVGPNYSYSASRGVSKKTIGSGSQLPLLTLRSKSSFNGIQARIGLLPDTVTMYSASQPLYIRVVLNATITGASYTSVNNYSNAEFDIAATAATGGITVWEGYVDAGTSLLGGNVPGAKDGGLTLWELGFNYPGTVADTLTITARSLGNNTDVLAAIRWLEFQ